MTSLRTLVCTVALATFSITGFAADPAEHDAHHPASTPPKAVAKPAPKASSDQMMKMDSQMKAMQEMHEKIMAAKTPEERKALMAEHMKMMQDGMSMMNSMMGGGKSGKSTMSPEQMQKHMEMMQSMMQMMMDRMEMTPPAK